MHFECKTSSYWNEQDIIKFGKFFCHMIDKYYYYFLTNVETQNDRLGV